MIWSPKCRPASTTWAMTSLPLHSSGAGRSSKRRVLEPSAATARRRRSPLENGDDPAAEVRVGGDDVRQHLVGAPLFGLRPLGEAPGRHGVRRRREIGHGRRDLRDDLGRRLLGALRLEVAADPFLLVRHDDIV